MASTAPSPQPSSLSSPYPFATAPDIIRAHQKDAYFTGSLTNTLADLHRRLLGARSAHAWASEARTAADLLYLSLTTLAGNRTLGEEYCDVVQVDASDGQLPALRSRAGYIAGSVLLPYALGRVLPGFRARVRRQLEARIRALEARVGEKGMDGRSSRERRVCAYVLKHLGTLTSGAPIHAVTLALFYFSGTYYELTKRLVGLRYVFTRKVPSTPDRAGYEVLGLLLVIQMALQGYLHIRTTITSSLEERQRERLGFFADVDVSLDENSYSANTNVLLTEMGTPGAAQSSHLDIGKVMHTPVLQGARYDLQDESVMRYIAGKQQRKCTLCLDEMKDPSATQCGHVFCWACIGDWVREKPECPLCRREAMAQHILPLRVA